DAASTKDDLRRLLHVSPAKVDVVPLGIGVTRRVDPLPEANLRRWLGAGDRPILLSVSAKLPHKNLLRLIAALAMVPAAHRPLLVLPGYPTPHEQELRQRAGTLGL